MSTLIKAPLVARRVAGRLKLSLRDMHRATGMPRTTLMRLLAQGEWPAKANESRRDAVRETLHALFENEGAQPDELAQMFNPDLPLPGGANATEEDPEMLLPKQVLTPVARRHFKLFSNPFDGDVIKDDQMFNGDDVRYVREAAWQCAQNSSFVAVVGESGAGKTTIQTDLEERIRRSADPVTIIKPSVLGMEQTERQGTQMRSGDILHAIITQLDPQRSVPQTPQARTVLAHKLLAASAEVGNTHLLVVEEAHSMPNAALKHLKRLHEMRLGRRPLLGILLLAQTELKTRLANGLRDGSLREVAQRCEVVELLPLDNDLRAYLECRASAAGVRLDALMDGPAVDQLRARLTIRSRDGRGGATSMCYPLAVNNMMTKCLNEAAELGVPMVNKDIVAAA